MVAAPSAGLDAAPVVTLELRITIAVFVISIRIKDDSSFCCWGFVVLGIEG